ncbi:hypothetical protein M0R45_003112 [Rubus argutus]|uniref:Uncharacterized protein n=1 Tax=Rubus argutus TaxID=59490 RepID=A0AAW1YGZ7_RUBAR
MWLYINKENEGLQDRRLKPAAEDLMWIGCERVLVIVAEEDHLNGVGRSYVGELKKGGWKGCASLHLSSSSSSDFDDILIECESGSDRIRRLSVPDSELRYNSLVVLKSRVYLIGGDIEIQIQKNEDGTTDKEKKIGYRHLDLGVGQWGLEGGKSIEDQFGAAAVGHDGLIYSVGCQQYRLSPDGIVEKLTPPPPPLSHEGGAYESRLLGLTSKKLFIYTIGAGVNCSNLLLSYDLESGTWDDKYDNFFGFWSAGVVLYNDRYLFSFGTQNLIPPRRKMVVPGIYVFDIERRQWLPEPVEGLRTDGTVLPRVYRTKPADDYMGPGYSPYLFQIGNKHKLALLWDSRAMF